MFVESKTPMCIFVNNIITMNILQSYTNNCMKYPLQRFVYKIIYYNFK